METTMMGYTGFRVSGFRARDLGFRVRGRGLGVWSWGFGIRAWSSRSPTQDLCKARCSLDWGYREGEGGG